MLGDEKGEELSEEVLNLLWEGELGEAIKLLKGLDLPSSNAWKAQGKLIGYLEGNREGIGNYRELQEEGYLNGTMGQG